MASGRIWKENVWGNAVHRVAAEGISPEQAVDEAIARIKQILRASSAARPHPRMAPLGARAADLVMSWQRLLAGGEAVAEIVAAFEQETGKRIELVTSYFDVELPVIWLAQFGRMFLWLRWCDSQRPTRRCRAACQTRRSPPDCHAAAPSTAGRIVPCRRLASAWTSRDPAGSPYRELDLWQYLTEDGRRDRRRDRDAGRPRAWWPPWPAAAGARSGDEAEPGARTPGSAGVAAGHRRYIVGNDGLEVVSRKWWKFEKAA